MVPGAAIVIELPATDATSPFADALLDACNHGPNPDVHCTLASDTEAAPPSMIAVVSWQSPARLAVEVQVGVRETSGPQWSTRRLTFTETDAELERWRAVGLVIATLARQATDASSSPPAVTPPTPPPPKPPSVDSAAQLPAAGAQHGAWTLELAGELARGRSGVFGAYGGSLRLGRRITPRLLFATASARYDLAPFDDHVALRWAWLTAGVGIMAPLGNPQVTFEVRLEPTLGAISARLDQSAGGDSASGWLWGLREGAGVTWWWSQWLGLAISADAYQVNRGIVTRVSVNGDTAPSTRRVQPLGWSSSFGLRFGLDPG
jgi:hypothetical protein